MGMRPMMGMRDSLGMPKEFWPMHINERLAQRLNLTAEQQEAIQEIMERRRTESSSLLEEIYPRLRASLDSMHAEIRALLTEEQAEGFDRFQGEGPEMFMRRLEGRGPGPPGMAQRFP
jgi:Spy/CpxP family protein refolding chaperone